MKSKGCLTDGKTGGLVSKKGVGTENGKKGVRAKEKFQKTGEKIRAANTVKSGY